MKHQYKALIILLTTFFFVNLPKTSAQKDTLAIVENNRLAWELRDNNLDSSVLLSKKALELLDKLPKTISLPLHWKEKNTAKTFYYLGTFYREIGDAKLMFDYYNKALKISGEINDLHIISQTQNGIGNAYLAQSKFPEALNCFLQSLQIDEKRGFKKGISMALANIGTVYDAQKNFPKALIYYNKALKLAEELKDNNRKAIQLGNIGIVYHEMHNLPRALENYSLALTIYKEIANKKGLAMTLNNMASIYKDQEKYKESLGLYTEAQKLAEELGHTDLIAACIGNTGIIYTQLKQYPKAETLLLKALALTYEINSLESIQEFEGALSELYTLQGKSKEALEHYKKHISISDSLTNLENIEKTMRMEMAYEFDKMQTVEKEVHKKEVLLLEAKNKTNKQFQLFLYAIIALTLLLLFFARRAYRNKKQHAEFLSLEAQRKELLLQEVHHRINNNQQFISGLLTLQANVAEDQKLVTYLQQGQHRIESLSVLHELLYQNNSQTDINMKEYLSKVIAFHSEILISKYGHARISLQVEDANFPTKMAVPIGLIVNELVTNSIKYAFHQNQEGVIEVLLNEYNKTKKEWCLQVNDNGSGMKSDAVTKKESLGLRLVNLMSKQLGGRAITDWSKGAKFSLIFKIE